jgi:stage V sporulation protein G
MEITQVKIFPVEEEKLKAFVSVVFDHCFMVNDIKVIQGKDGLFLSMPSRRKKSGEFKDVAHPLNNETRRMLEEKVLAEYRQEVDDPTPRRPDRADDDDAPALPAAAAVASEKTLEEVQEMHLSDSFWSVS